MTLRHGPAKIGGTRLLPHESIRRGSLDLLIGSIVIFASAFLNRIAGGGLPTVTEFPGRAMLYAAAGMFALSALWLSWQRKRWAGLTIPLWIAASYALWRTFEWGTVFDLGRRPDEEPRSPFGLLFFLTGSDYADLWLRMSVGLLPGAAIGVWIIRRGGVRMRLRSLLLIWLGLATGIWLAYVLAWELQTVFAIPLAELITGSVWGLAVLSASTARRSATP